MLTIRAEIKKKEKRSDGTYNVKITFTLNRKVKRLATDLYVTTSDLTKSLDFKENTSIKRDIDNLVFYYQKLCSRFPIDYEQSTMEDVMAYINGENMKNTIIDFIEFAESWMQTSKNTSTKNYKSAVNALKLYGNQWKN